jgi:hypothetical protein
MDQSIVDALDMREWAMAERFDDFASMCCRKPHLNLLTDPDEFSLSHRVARMGSVLLAETIVGSGVSMDCAELCDAFRVVVLVSGHMECVHTGVSVCLGSAVPWCTHRTVSARRDGQRAPEWSAS